MFAKAKAYYKEHFIKDMLSFSGRMSRKEMTCRMDLLLLTWLVLYFVFVGVLFFIGLVSANHTALFALTTLLAICVIFVPLLIEISLSVRRLHDLGYSGWWIFLGVILLFSFGFGKNFLDAGTEVVLTGIVTTVSGVVVFVLLSVMPGEERANAYGLPPANDYNSWWDAKENRNFECLKKYILTGEWKKDYFTFKGRLTSREFFFLVCGATIYQMAAMILWSLMAFMLPEMFGIAEAILVIINIVYISMLYPVNVRRNHDFGNSWVWTLLILIPGVNIWYLLRQFCFTGDLEENKYGEPRTWIDENGVLRNNDY